MGAATADAFYASLAGLGLTFVAQFLIHGQTWLRFAGGIFLLYLGLRIFLRSPAGKDISSKSLTFLGDYLVTFFLTLANPLTILFFAAIFAGLGMTKNQGSYLSTGVWILGVFIGSAFWWYILSSTASIFRTKIKPENLTWINRISGSVILAFGLWAILK